MTTNTYRQLFNAHAYRQMNITAEVPDVRLCVGDAEVLAPQKLEIYKNAKAPTQPALIDKLDKQTIEQTGKTGDGATFQTTDFTGGFYIGEPVSGVI